MKDEGWARLDVRVRYAYSSGAAVACAFTSDALVTALVGPSGCGKSTVLALLAGLLTPAEGWVRVGGRDLTNVPPARRGVGLAFQDQRLFPHLRVRDNLLYGARRRGARSSPPLAEVAAALELTELLHRWPDQLAGGQRQRVGLGRALLSGPSLLLFDEPLTALDAALKERVLAYLSDVLPKIGVPVVYVAHAADEVARLAGHVVEMPFP